MIAEENEIFVITDKMVVKIFSVLFDNSRKYMVKLSSKMTYPLFNIYQINGRVLIGSFGVGIEVA